MTVSSGPQARPAYGPAKGFDWWLFLATLGLFVVGLTALRSVDVGRLGGAYFPKQFLFGGIGIGAMVAMALVRPQFWSKLWPFIYAGNLVLLIATLFLGVDKFGAQRWLDVGPIELQPSEVTKLAMAICLGSFFAGRGENIKTAGTFFLSVALTLPVMVLLMLQPHFGATMGIVVLWLGISVAAGVPWKFPLGAFLLLATVLIGAFYSPKLPPQMEYMRERIVGKLKPDNSDNNYQVHQAMLAISSGGVFGKGLNNGDRKKNGYVPFQHNDFIFSVIGEEGGLVGSAVVLLLYCFFFVRAWWIAVKAKSDFSRLMCIGLVSVLGFHTIVNLGMNLGLTPVVGLWLPFMSYGITALWMCMISVGLLLSVERFDVDR